MRAQPPVIKDITAKRTSLRRVIRLLGETSDTRLRVGGLTLEKLDHIKTLLETMNADLVELIQIKQSDGFFDEILARAPERRHTVEQIISDYHQLVVQLERIQKELGELDHAPTARRLLDGWLTRFHELDSREVTLLQEVWNVDLGAAD